MANSQGIFDRQWAGKPSANRRQFLLLSRACRDAAFAKRRGIDQRFACENFMADMRRACRVRAHARLIGVSQRAACRRVREGLSSKKDIREIVRFLLLEGLVEKPSHTGPGGRCPPGQHLSGGRCVPNKADITVDDLETEGGLLSPEQGPKKCPRGQVREPITGRCVPKRRIRRTKLSVHTCGHANSVVLG